MNNQIRTVIESRLLPYVERPMRYAGGELNMICKDLSTISVHGVLCFPDLYDIGMSHTGLQILYHIINKEKNWALSRCFHPWGDAEAIMRREKIPLYTLEYYSPVGEADFIGFTVQYELQFTNIVNMLDLAGLHPLRTKRSEHDPLVIAGGPCVSNPEPLSDFIDVFVIGDGEIALFKIAQVLESAKKSHTPRQELLQNCAKIDGVYVPAHFNSEKVGQFHVVQLQGKPQVRAAKIPELDDANYPSNPVVPLIEVVHKRLAVEVMRGCSRGCRFCSAGTYYRPVRERTAESVCSQIRNGIASTGWEEIGLLSLSTADHTSFSRLLTSLHAVERDFPVSCTLPSTRVDALTHDQLDLLEKVTPVQSFTIAPEAGSERLRRVINKDFTDDVIYHTIQELMQRNVQTLKLYFMLGLPTENSDDIDALITMVKNISGMVRSASGRRMVNVSLSPFSPKPHTPFQREKMEEPAALIQKGAFIKRTLAPLKNVKVVYRNPDQTVLETLMARGDRSISSLVYHVWQQGARFDGWDECFDIRKWISGASSLSIDISHFLGTIVPEQVLPWSVVSTGISEEFLERERQCAYKGESTADCRHGACVQCGVCNSQVKPHFSQTAESEEKYSIMNIKSIVPSEQLPDTYRFYYHKTGKMRFLGHLDTVAVIHRAARMANYPLMYSNGFNPHPKIAFGPPLPFGVEGKHEAFDAVIRNSFQDDPLIINNWLPEGLHIDSYKKIGIGSTSLNAAIASARYHFSPIVSIDADTLYRIIASISSSASLVISVEKKGNTVEKDIRKGILDISPFGLTGEWSANLVLNGAQSCKPSELVRVMFPSLSHSEINIIRDACFDACNREI